MAAGRARLRPIVMTSLTTMLAVLPMIALPLLMLRLGRQIHRRFEAVQEHFGTLTTQVQENLSGVRVVRTAEPRSARRVTAVVDRILAAREVPAPHMV